MHEEPACGSYLLPRGLVDAPDFPLAEELFDDEAELFLPLLDAPLLDAPEPGRPRPAAMPLRADVPAPLLFELFEPPCPDADDPEAAPLLRADGELAGLFVAALLEDFVPPVPVARLLPVPLLFVLLLEGDALFVLLVVPVPAEDFTALDFAALDFVPLDFVVLLPLRPLVLPLPADPPVAGLPVVDPLLLRVMLLPFAGAFPLAEELDVEEELPEDELFEAELFDADPVDPEPFDADPRDADPLDPELLDAEPFDAELPDPDPLLPLLLPEPRFGCSSTSPTFSPTVLAASPTKSTTVEAVSEITSVTDS